MIKDNSENFLKDNLDTIVNQLNNNTSIFIVISGLPGCGKTKVLNKIRKKLNTVIFHDCSDEITYEDDILDILNDADKGTTVIIDDINMVYKTKNPLSYYMFNNKFINKITNKAIKNKLNLVLSSHCYNSIKTGKIETAWNTLYNLNKYKIYNISDYNEATRIKK